MKTLLALSVCACLVSGCTSPSSGDLSRSERRELMNFTSAGFEMPKDHIADVFGILRAVKATVPEKKVRKITFDLMRGTTVYFTASEKNFIHGGPFAQATKVGDEWKLGELWHLQ